MQQDTKIIKFGLLFVIALIFQVAFGFADVRDTPNKAVVEFTSAYYKFDKEDMTGRLCEESLMVEEDNTVDRYIYDALQKVRARGYRPFYMKDCLYHVATQTIEKTHEAAKIRLTCDVKSPLRYFFTKEIQSIDETFDLVYEDGKWKVCGNPLGMVE